MIIDDRFNVQLIGIKKGVDGWVADAKLFPDPKTLKRTSEFYDKSCKQLAAFLVSESGSTPARAFAKALQKIGEYVVECEDVRQKR